MKRKDKKSLLDFPKKPLKIVGADTQLPHVFDLLWDAKFGSDLECLARDEDVKEKIRQHLGENGFDAREWAERSRNHETD
jgi:hypothetical protein